MPHVLEPSQILRLLRAAKEDSERAWLMILLAFNHALRASEVVGLRPSNVVGAKLVLSRKKNSNPVEDDLVVSLNPLLDERKAVFDLCRQTPRNQKLFPISTRTFQRWVHRYGEAADLPKRYCHPHTLKHSILDYLRETMQLEELQDRSGHKSLDSLRIYLHPKKAVVDAKVAAALGKLAV